MEGFQVKECEGTASEVRKDAEPEIPEGLGPEVTGRRRPQECPSPKAEGQPEGVANDSKKEGVAVVFKSCHKCEKSFSETDLVFCEHCDEWYCDDCNEMVHDSRYRDLFN